MMAKNKNIILNHEQIEKLYEIAQHFKDIKHFEVETDHSSGIGTSVRVKFDLFDNKDTTIDITDVKDW
jgi:hypothetical protein